MDSRKDLHDTSCNSFLTDFLILRTWAKLCARKFVSSNSKSLTPDFPYILAVEVKTEKLPLIFKLDNSAELKKADQKSHK